MVTALSDALDGLQQLAQEVLIARSDPDAAAPLQGVAESDESLSEVVSGPAYTVTDEKDAHQHPWDVGNSASSTTKGVGKSADICKPSKAKKARGTDGGAALLAAGVAHNLQLVQQLLPATQRERYVGSLGSYM